MSVRWHVRIVHGARFLATGATATIRNGDGARAARTREAFEWWIAGMFCSAQNLLGLV